MGHGAGLERAPGHQHGGVFVDLGQVAGDVIQPALLLNVVIVDAPQGVVVIDVLRIAIAVAVVALSARDRARPQLADEPSLGNVFLHMVAVEEEHEVIMEAFLGLPLQLPGKAEQVLAVS